MNTEELNRPTQFELANAPDCLSGYIFRLEARINELDEAIREHSDSFNIVDVTEEDRALWALLDNTKEIEE